MSELSDRLDGERTVAEAPGEHIDVVQVLVRLDIETPASIAATSGSRDRSVGGSDGPRVHRARLPDTVTGVGKQFAWAGEELRRRRSDVLIAEAADGRLLLTGRPDAFDAFSLARLATGDEGGEVTRDDYLAWRQRHLRSEDSLPDREFWAQAPAIGRSRGPVAAETRVEEVGTLQLWDRVRRFASEQRVDPGEVALTGWLLTIRMLEHADRPAALRLTDGRFNTALRDVAAPMAVGLPCWLDAGQEVGFASLVRQVGEMLRQTERHAVGCDTAAWSPAAPAAYGVAMGRGPQIAGILVEAWRDIIAAAVWLDLTGPNPVVRSRSRLSNPSDSARLLAAVLDRCLDVGADGLDTSALLGADRAEARWKDWSRPTGPSGRTLLDAAVGACGDRLDAVAISRGSEHRSYGDLLRGAGAAATRLRRLGLPLGATVPVVAEPDLDLPAVLLGIMACGASYAPIDPNNGPARTALLLDQVRSAGAPIVGYAPEANPPGDLLRPADLVSPLESGAELRALSDPHLPAYVICTSGSTGVPNPVVVGQEAAGDYVRWSAEHYKGGGPSLLCSSLGFDLTVTALWTPLIAGDGVRLPEVSGGVAGVAAELRRPQHIGILKLTPTQLRMALSLTGRSVTASITSLVLGGEPLTDDLVAAATETFPDVNLVNEYGPTEATVGATAAIVDPMAGLGTVPIGHPVAGATIAIVDPTGSPVPRDVVGELLLGGSGLALGYRDRPRLTAERFVPDPRGAGARVYRTGDLVAELADHGLRYLGRRDRQAKVLGVRVEPGEVESTLRSNDAVSDAAVRLVDIPGRSSGPVLAAYVEPATAVAIETASLARHCRERLPDALVPVAFVVLDALPRSVNGKIDLDRLPPIADIGAGVRSGAPATPATLEESILAEVMADVLGLVEVGVEDDYFALGGDSIRSVMIVAGAEARGVHLEVADLHAHPTIRGCLARRERSTAARRKPVGPFELVPEQDRALLDPELDDAFPLNLLQEGMIFHRSFAAKSAVYHAIASVIVRAPLEPETLAIVVDGLLRRHPMLRTSFDLDRFSIPLQLVHSNYDVPLEVIDVSQLDHAAAEAAVLEWVEAEKQRGFDLTSHPLIRFVAHDFGDGRWRFTYGFHHEIVDGWSEALLVTELFDHYFSLVFDEPIALREPEATMREAVALELEAIDDPANYAFWDSYLEDVTLMRLPRFGQRPVADDGSREIVRSVVDIPKSLSDDVKLLARELSIPVKHVLLATHLAVMRVYGGHLDTLTYTVTQGRPEGTDGSTAIGLFVNSLALRLRFAAMTWAELIGRTLASETESLPYRRLPMAELKRHLGHEPLAETLFFFTDYHVFHELDRWKARDVAGVDTELYGESTFPFCSIFRTNRESGDLEARLEWDALQFDTELMDDIGRCYEMVLAAMVADPHHRIDLDPLVPRFDRELHLAGLSAAVDEPGRVDGGRADDHRQVHSVLDMIAARAQAAPDSIAISGGAVVTYRGLLERTAELADWLVDRGLPTGGRVALALDRGPNHIAAMLAAMWVGGSYVSLATDLPVERLVEEVERSGSDLVVAHDGVALPQPAPFQVELLPPAGSARRPLRRPRPVHAEQPAYVMMTSGSTGRPKAVVVPHGSLAASTSARFDYYAGQPPRRFLHLSPLHFDSSLAGLYWTLCAGGELDLVETETLLDPMILRLRAQSASHLLAVPALYAEMLRGPSRSPLAGLHVAISAGEALQDDVVDLHRTNTAGAALVNEYGPTEATIWATAYRVPPQLPVTVGVPIGRPVAGVHTVVVDGFGHPVPLGVQGELVVGGEALATGYHDEPAATARAFVPDALAGGGQRRYRTGDLARFLETGDIEFHGRADDQVKIRGFRIELAEVERVLEANPEIRRAAVTAPMLPGGERVLVAHVVPAADGLTSGRVIDFVRSKLPKHMVPARIVFLETLPLTAAGKLSRQELEPVPAQAQAQVVAPTTPTEEALCGLVAELLGLPSVGVTASFFDLGGESLLAMKIVNRLNRLFDTELSIKAFFGLESLGEIAATVDELVAAGPVVRSTPERGSIQ